MNPSAKWFGRVVWAGILVNMVFVIALLFFPVTLLTLFHMQVPEPIIWVRAAGLLLLEISILYIPGAQDPYRYKATAWMSIFVTRGGGACFFFGAVFVFGQDFGFLMIATIDLIFGVTEAILLYRALRDGPDPLEKSANVFS